MRVSIIGMKRLRETRYKNAIYRSDKYKDKSTNISAEPLSQSDGGLQAVEHEYTPCLQEQETEQDARDVKWHRVL